MESLIQMSEELTLLHRFSGRLANELSIICRPENPFAPVSQQAESVFKKLGGLLAAHAASNQHVVRETIFVRDIQQDLPAILEVRSQLGMASDPTAVAPPVSVIQQAPLIDGNSLEVSVQVLAPRDGHRWSVRDVWAEPACTCAGCAQTQARLVQLGDQSSLHATNVYGIGRDTHEQTLNMFHAAERLLQQGDMNFGDVVRVWIYMRDIDRDYADLNKARRVFFQQLGIDLRPASTCVQGGPMPLEHDVTLTIEAIRSSPRPRIQRMSTPKLNEAWTYGADFSRGLRVSEANKVALHVSGTASLDEAGQTVHVGDLEAQAHRMIDNIESLLANQGASLADIASGVAYVKQADHASVLRTIFHQRGFDRFPCAVVHGPLCRPELLCETEVVAWLPTETEQS